MSSTLKLECSSSEQLPEIAKQILVFAGEEKLFLVNGKVGSGKTTLIKALCKQLGSLDHFSSPTFSIVNEYTASKGNIFHFDLYRVKNQEELFDIGIEEYISSGNYCFFEWPELLIDIINGSYIQLEIEVKENIRYLRLFK